MSQAKRLSMLEFRRVGLPIVSCSAGPKKLSALMSAVVSWPANYKKTRASNCSKNINARDLPNHPEIIAVVRDVNLCVVDVSFISLTLILPATAKSLGPHHLLALIKPQFELSAQALGKDGVVQSTDDQNAAKVRVQMAAEQAGYQIFAILPAALKGSDGNQEFFLYAQHGVG